MATRRKVSPIQRINPLVFGAVIGLLFIAAGSFAMITGHSFHRAAGGIVGASSHNFDVSQYHLEGDKVVFDYYLPKEGVTRVKLENDQGKLIWQSQYNRESGDNHLRLNSEKLHKGETYTFIFEYKMDTVRREVVMN